HMRFRPGLTGIIGPNGAGKSTILEAIAWTVYGAPAARGTNDTLRFNRAPRRSRVEVRLTFELGGHEYRVARTLHDAEVHIDGGGAPAATGIAGVSTYLQSRLGMDRQEFFNTYFTGQKELQFLAGLGPTERARFLSRLLGYERLRRAQDRVRARRSELRAQLEGLRSGMGDPIALERALAIADARLAEATVRADAAEQERARAGAALMAVVPRWTEAQKARDKARDNTHAADDARRELERAERDLERTGRELETIAEAGTELAGLRVRLEALPGIVAEHEAANALARVHERRAVLERSVRSAREELAGQARRIATLEKAPALVKQYEEELAAAREALEAADETVATLAADWERKKQEVSTRLLSARDRARELQQKIRELKKAGPDGTCPTCERPLRSEFANVVGRLEDELVTLTQDGKWLSQRQKQLEKKPEDLADAEKARDRAHATADDLRERLARSEQAVQELWTLAAERKRREERLAELDAELAALPADYNAQRHAALTEEMRALHALEKRAERLASVVEAGDDREAEHKEAKKRAAAARRRITILAKEAAALGYSDDRYEEDRAAHDAAAEALRRAELLAVELTGHASTAGEARSAAVRALKDYKDRIASLHRVKLLLRHHHELDTALNQLREDLNTRVRPELAELASAFLTDITDGRYTALEIDDAYNVTVMDEGDEKPVISGGEEDIANLVLRLAISQMIAERAGQQLSILILDEVFGSLDIEHRDNVIQLLHKLDARFEQVILITHVEGVREGLDNVLRVEYDERSGSSVVTEESVGGVVRFPSLVN
ncbi:MAG: SMC family ATPase, partial [Gemmatimonadetes bacterium]|nr:SMC family ATPase [Gemmatimonadota bacterium]